MHPQFDPLFLKMLVLRGMIPSFLLTELFESLAFLCFPQRNRHDWGTLLLVNVITNPMTVYLDFLFRYRLLPPYLFIFLLEMVVWLVEALIYRRTLRQTTNPFLFSFVLNGASYFLGLLVQPLYF